MPPQVFLFQHVAYMGGVWQATHSLMHELVDINRNRKQLRLALGIDNKQLEVDVLSTACPELKIERMKTYRARGLFIRWRHGSAASQLGFMKKYTFFDPGKLALESDLWVALVDRFRQPLAPLRPYGVLIHDMIQRHIPESFSPSFLERDIPHGMVPTIQQSQFQITTTTSTAEDVQIAYGTPKNAMHVLPVAHEPKKRFTPIESVQVPGVHDPFILNIANASPHKGARVLLQGFARWKRKSGDQKTQLVICGWDTQFFSKHSLKRKNEYCNEIRQLVNDLELQEGRDVVFLGHVSDSSLKWLFERTKWVINAASFDNGSYSMIEAVWFGKPMISSNYPAAKCIDLRFELGSTWFENGNSESLAQAMEKVVKVQPLGDAELANQRDQLSLPELSIRVFAERFYDTLLHEVSRVR